ncbi:MAG: hypothetical protein IPJ65_00485 [Archangiaceae bacterium]|nr:hypothetical protein [Archangiaceae bacterium]
MVAEGAFLRFVTEVDVEDYLPSVISIEAEGFPPVGLEVGGGQPHLRAGLAQPAKD